MRKMNKRKRRRSTERIKVMDFFFQQWLGNLTQLTFTCFEKLAWLYEILSKI